MSAVPKIFKRLLAVTEKMGTFGLEDLEMKGEEEKEYCYTDAHHCREWV